MSIDMDIFIEEFISQGLEAAEDGTIVTRSDYLDWFDNTIIDENPELDTLEPHEIVMVKDVLWGHLSDEVDFIDEDESDYRL